MTNLPNGSSGVDAALAGLQPGKKLQGSLSVRTCALGDEEHVQALARYSESPRQFNLFSAATQRTADGGGQFIPERGVRTGRQRVVAEGRPPGTLELSNVGGGGVGGSDKVIGDRHELV